MKTDLEIQLLQMIHRSLDSFELLNFNYVRLNFQNHDTNCFKISAYHRSWEIVLNNKIILNGDTDSVILEQKFDSFFNDINYSLKGIYQLLDQSIEFFFNNGLSFKVYPDPKEKELLIIFNEQDICFEYIKNKGWRMGPSNIPYSKKQNGTYYRPFADINGRSDTHLFVIEK